MTALWEHQSRGVEMIERQTGTMLAWEMGTGKSRAIVEYVNRHTPQRTLIVCPKSVVTVWPREFAKHCSQEPLARVVPVTKGTTEQRRNLIKSLLDNDDSIVIVINYESIWRLPLGPFMKRQKWDLIVCDEIHRIKSPSGKQSRFMGTLGTRAAKRVGLTGTPMPHSPLDVYAQYRFLDPEIYGYSNTAFKAKYAVFQPISFAAATVNKVVGFKNQEDLQERFYRIADRVRKSEVLDLPEQLHVIHPVELSKKAQRAYDGIKDEFISEIEEGVITAANALVKIVRMQQITSGFVKTDEGGIVAVDDSKAASFADLLEDLGPEEPVAVFCNFHRSLDQVKTAAEKAGRKFQELSGRTNDIGSYWNAEPGAVLAVQIQSGGVGIDLTECSQVVYWDQTHNLGNYDQSLARVHRPGQKRNVTYHHLIATGTIDADIQKALERRMDVIESILTVYKGGEHDSNDTLAGLSRYAA